MTDSEIIATIKLTSLETGNEVTKCLERLIKEYADIQTKALLAHEFTCPAKSDIANLMETVGYTTKLPDDTVHRRIQKVEITLWKFVVFIVGSAGIGGIGGEIVSKLWGG